VLKAHGAHEEIYMIATANSMFWSKVASTKEGTNTELEMRVHTLVEPLLSKKCPRMIKALVGFESLDENDDESKVVGVYVFNIARQHVYVPVIYEDGKVSGLNLLYLEDEDVFRPLSEEQIDKLFERAPYAIGKVPSRKDQFGMTPQPLFQSLAPTFGKLATVHNTGMRNACVDVSQMPAYKSAMEHLDLGNFIMKYGSRAGAAMMSVLNTMQKDDAFGRAMFEFYGTEKLAVIADKVDKIPMEPAPLSLPYEGRPRIITGKDDALSSSKLTKDQKDEMRRDGLVVLDNRDEKDVTKAYRTETPRTWFAPNTTGTYRLATLDGGTIEAHVSSDLVTVGDGSAGGLVAVSDGKGGYFSRKAMLATDAMTGEQWEDRFDKLSKISSIGMDNADNRKRFRIVNIGHQSTLPLRWLGKTRESDGTIILYVRQDQDPVGRNGRGGPCCSPPACSYPGNQGYDRNSDAVNMEYSEVRSPFVDRYANKRIEKGETKKSELERWDYETGRRVIILPTADNDRMQNVGDTLYVGKDCRFEEFEDDPDVLLAPSSQNLWPLIKAGGGKKLSITSDRGEYQVGCGVIKSGRCTRREAAIHLIKVHGLRKEAAVEMLKQSDASSATKQPTSSWAVKYAYGFPEVEAMGGGSDYNNQQAIGYENVSQQMNESVGQGPFLSQDIASAQRAAMTGDKTSFDTSVIMGLIRNHNVGAYVDDIMGDLTLGLDRVGRVLFMLYTHRKEFQDRIGEENLPQVEDNLENTFEQLGECLLELERPSIRPSEERGILGEEADI
jgi:hypothetical protein